MLSVVSHSVMSDTFVTPWTVAHQAPQCIGFPREEYWSGLPFPSPMAGSLERSYSSQPVFALPSLYIFKDSEHKKDPFKISSLVGTARRTINGVYG